MEVNCSHFVLLSLLLFPLVHGYSIWNIFGSSKVNLPKFEEGECSHWDRNNVYYSTYDSDDLTGFHRTLPRGSYAIVYNERTNKSVSVRIVGDGPIADGRVMELSPAAFEQVERLSEVVFECKVYKPQGTYLTPTQPGAQGTIGGGPRPGAAGNGYGRQPPGNLNPDFGYPPSLTSGELFRKTRTNSECTCTYAGNVQ